MADLRQTIPHKDMAIGAGVSVTDFKRGITREGDEVKVTN